MAIDPPRTNRRGPLRDWMVAAAWLGTVPGWVFSLGFHVVLYVGLVSLTQMPSCRGDYSGEEGDGFRAIGLKSRTDANSAPSAAEGTPGETTSQATLADVSASSLTEAPAISDQPPVPLTMPKTGAGPSVLGLGPPPLPGFGGPPAAMPGTGNQTAVGHPGSRGGGGGSSQGPGQTSLFGVNDSGKTFVYLIDRSSSMEDYGAFRAAKSELLASLQRLTEVQQFQVIFYDNAPHTLTPPEGRFRMFFGTDAQRLVASEQIRGILPQGGTHHLEAILEALRFNPDVIFMLTDGATPVLKKSELDQIRSVNHGTHIHCIEFGVGNQTTSQDGSTAGNFLMKLASQNDGKYTYRDVKQFAKSTD